MKLIQNANYPTPRNTGAIHAAIENLPEEYRHIGHRIAAITNNYLAATINREIEHLEAQVRELQSQGCTAAKCSTIEAAIGLLDSQTDNTLLRRQAD